MISESITSRYLGVPSPFIIWTGNTVGFNRRPCHQGQMKVVSEERIFPAGWWYDNVRHRLTSQLQFNLLEILC